MTAPFPNKVYFGQNDLKVFGLLREKCKENTGIYSKSITRRFGIWSDDTERVYWPVHGWASKT